MPEKDFNEMIGAKWLEGKSVCVGLDSDPVKIPEIMRDRPDQGMSRFNYAIIDATRDLVCAYKPNTAFYESLGLFGMIALRDTVTYIKLTAPGVPIIGDMKRGDIDNTNWAYVKEAFEYFDFDAVTINPYLGKEALQPFLDQRSKGIFVLCRTSNKGSDEFQGRNIIVLDRQIPLYQYVAHRVATDWNSNGNCGLVVGATFPEELAHVREVIGDEMPLLIPAIGKQGGDLKETVKAARSNMIINASRSIIFASSGCDFAETARKETIKLQKEISRYLPEKECK